jgi:WD40 repeat protein
MRTRFLCVGLIAFFAAAIARSETSSSHKAWAVKPDPANEPDLDKPIDPGGMVQLRAGRVVTPSYSGKFIALDPQIRGQKMDGEWWQVYDLKNLKPVGPAFTAPADFANPHFLSPDGAYLANRSKGQHGIIDVWDCKTGKLARSIEVTDGSENRYGFPADFAGPNRLLTMCHPGLFPLAEAPTHYQVWDVATGKELSHFDVGLVWSCKWATISPGGRYLVMELTERRSYRLLAWDLSTGQSAGEAEFQGKDEPWGQACGVVFSPDAKRLAIVWRLGQKDVWGRVFVFDVLQGRRVASFPLDYTMKSIGLGLNLGDRPALQWTADGESWLILGHLLMDARTGAVIGRIGKEPGSGAVWTVQRRCLVGANFVTDVLEQGFDRKLRYIAVTTKN